MLIVIWGECLLVIIRVVFGVNWIVIGVGNVGLCENVKRGVIIGFCYLVFFVIWIMDMFKFLVFIWDCLVIIIKCLFWCLVFMIFLNNLCFWL